MKLHEGEVDIDLTLVEQLVATQFPRFSELPLCPVESSGTVNAIYRLGEELCVRLPRLEKWAPSLEKELRWLPRLAPHLSLEIPEAVAVGAPANGYPLVWAIYRWIDGRPYRDELVDDGARAGKDLAQFVKELRRVNPAGGPSGGRKPLRQLDDITRRALAAAGCAIDTVAATAVWDSAVELPLWEGNGVWIHADLLRPNVLVDGGRVRAVVDFGGVGVGDPAADVIAAWSVFGPVGRAAFRECLDIDDQTWNRGRGYALHQAAMIIPYYNETDPAFVDLAKRTLDQILFDGHA
jgi:aminoglycoside phosphotransferase (APT) family kinase protein